MQEVSEAAEIITEKTDKNVKVIFGTVIDESMGDDIRITVIATGFEDRERKAIMPDNIDINGAYTGKKSFYPTSIFTKKNTPKIEEKIVMEEDEEEDDDVVGVFNKKPLETVKIEEKKKDDNNADEEDLEIPAFIRKKMGL